jgi:hypothetical protein
VKIIRNNNIEHTGRTRDAALRRLSRTNRWLIAGTALLTGVLTDVAANAFPGHKVAVGKGTARTTRASHAKHEHKPLAPPATAPKAATEAAPQTSAPSETPAPAESESPPVEETAASSQQAAPESAPAPEAREEAPAPEPEPSEPVVSGGS